MPSWHKGAAVRRWVRRRRVRFLIERGTTVAAAAYGHEELGQGREEAGGASRGAQRREQLGQKDGIPIGLPWIMEYAPVHHWMRILRETKINKSGFRVGRGQFLSQ